MECHQKFRDAIPGQSPAEALRIPSLHHEHPKSKQELPASPESPTPIASLRCPSRPRRASTPHTGPTWIQKTPCWPKPSQHHAKTWTSGLTPTERSLSFSPLCEVGASKAAELRFPASWNSKASRSQRGEACRKTREGYHHKPNTDSSHTPPTQVQQGFIKAFLELIWVSFWVRELYGWRWYCTL